MSTLSNPVLQPAAGDTDNQLLRKLLQIGSAIATGSGGGGAPATEATSSAILTAVGLANKEATQLSVLAAVQANGNVGGYTTLLKSRPTIDTALYAAGDCIGGKLTLASALRTSGGSGILESLTIVDESNQKAALEILIFDADPTASTLTDQAPVVLNTADNVRILAHITVSASDYVTVASTGLATFKGLGITLKAGAASTSLYAAIVAVGGPTYTANNDLLLHWGILQD